MGRIFTQGAVESGKVPSTADFVSVQTLLRKEVCTSDAIIGALLLGSLVSGDANARSDVDCLVLYRAKARDTALKVLKELVVFAHEKNVPLKFIPCDHKSAKRGEHSLAETFFAHLKWARDNGGLIKEDPLPYYVFGTLGETHAYIVHKVEKIEKGRIELSIMSDEMRCHFLQKILEAPIHLARKVLWSKGIPYHLYDKKSDALACYEEHIGGVRAKLLREIVAADQSYTTALMRCLDSRPGSYSYSEFLWKIERRITLAEIFLRKNFSLVRPQ